MCSSDLFGAVNGMVSAMTMVSSLTLLLLLPPPPLSPPLPPPPPPSPLAQSTRYTDAACVALDTHAMRAVADQVAGSGPADVLSICTALGGLGACATFCLALEIDECWNLYVAQLVQAGTFPGGSLTAWMVLQAAKDLVCATRSTGSDCSDWAAIEPLARSYQYDALCACAWPEELPMGFLATHPGHAKDKAAHCARRFDGTYCRLAIDGLANHSADHGDRKSVV